MTNLNHRATPRHVNKALEEAKLPFKMERGEGYYWFWSTTDDYVGEVPSIYCWPRLTNTVGQIVQHVRLSMEKA